VLVRSPPARRSTAHESARVGGHREGAIGLDDRLPGSADHGHDLVPLHPDLALVAVGHAGRDCGRAARSIPATSTRRRPRTGEPCDGPGLAVHTGDVRRFPADPVDERRPASA
jgi:hypothetical protein